MKILFLHNNMPDYLAEPLFHGLRTLLGKNCVDVPRYDSMYAPLTEGLRRKLRGYGFTLYGLLPDIPELAEARYLWRQDLNSYDLIVVANIWDQGYLFLDLSCDIAPEKIVILDGYDTPTLFPYAWKTWGLNKRPWLYFAPVSKVKYFKRELLGKGASYRLEKFLPAALNNLIPLPKNAIPISFSIPKEKIWKGRIENKNKDFPKHIVDPEVAARVSGSFFSAPGSDQYIFLSEEDYYNDLRQSRFGITTKRAGWDCLRHYELAANGCVLCFRDLDLKPISCAPHGLNESNCIIYHNFDELKAKIDSISDEEYVKLKEQTYRWIESHTTSARANQFLEICSNSHLNL